MHILYNLTDKRFSSGLSRQIWSNFLKDFAVILSWDPVLPISTCSHSQESLELLHYKSLFQVKSIPLCPLKQSESKGVVHKKQLG